MPKTAAIEDAVLCPWTWPQLIGHTHICALLPDHADDHECMCGATTTRPAEGER